MAYPQRKCQGWLKVANDKYLMYPKLCGEVSMKMFMYLRWNIDLRLEKAEIDAQLWTPTGKPR